MKRYWILCQMNMMVLVVIEKYTTKSISKSSVVRPQATHFENLFMNTLAPIIDVHQFILPSEGLISKWQIWIS